MTEARSRPRRTRLRLGAILLVAFAATLAVLAALYAARRQLAREAVSSWLRARGVASESAFTELGPGRLIGRIQLGPAASPDLVVERAELRYSLAGLLSGKGVEVTSVRLTRPTLRARWHGGRFSAGSLDPLIEEFRKRPPQPSAPSPLIEIDDGVVQLSTDYGKARATADALIRDGKLVRLDARTSPMRLTGQGYTAELGGSVLNARVTRGRLSASLTAPFEGANGPQGSLGAGMLTVTAETSYPDPAQTPAAEGQATAELAVSNVRSGTSGMAALHLRAAAPWLRWTQDGGARLTGELTLAGDLHGLTAADLHLASAAANASGEFAAGRAPSLQLTANAEARGALTGLGGPVAGDSNEIIALKRGLRAFRVSAERVSLSLQDGGFGARLSGPVRLLPAGGGEVRLTPVGSGYRLTAAGGGLPKVEARIRRVAIAGGSARASLAAKAALSVGPLQDAAFDAAGQLRVADGRASFTASRCIGMTAARFDLGENDVERLTGRLCPASGPVLRLDADRWTIVGRVEQAAAAAPFLQTELSEARGSVRMAQAGGRLSGEVAVETAQVRDAAPEVRFHPLTMSGRMAAAGDVWRGALDFRLPRGGPVAHVVLTHDGRSGVGAAEVTTGRLAFAQGGLQPVDLSPLAEPLGSKVTGTADFAGGFRWKPAEVESGGALNLSDIGFKSPVGAVSGMAGRIEFSSLAPLVSPPGQALRAERVAAFLPLTDVRASLQLEEKALVVSGGQAEAGGGRLRLERLTVPLEKGGAIDGAVDVEAVQLHDAVKASPFADRVELDAKVSGRIPFAVQGEKVTIAGGELHAIAPGRLSIRRAALTSVSAEGSVEAPAEAAQQMVGGDTFTDFAFQAMEHLAFNMLDAGVNTRSDGRLGVLFHVVGHYDPPQRQEITLSWWDLIRRKFLNRKLPLPSGTGVDLTLDTSLNLDDLLKDYADAERLSSSPTVQP